MQKWNAYLCQTISYIYYQRARRTDAEPIIRSPWVRVIGSFVFWGGYQSKLPPYTMTLGGTRRFPWRDRRVHFAFSHYPWFSPAKKSVVLPPGSSDHEHEIFQYIYVNKNSCVRIASCCAGVFIYSYLGTSCPKAGSPGCRSPPPLRSERHPPSYLNGGKYNGYHQFERVLPVVHPRWIDRSFRWSGRRTAGGQAVRGCPPAADRPQQSAVFPRLQWWDRILCLSARADPAGAVGTHGSVLHSLERSQHPAGDPRPPSGCLCYPRQELLRGCQGRGRKWKCCAAFRRAWFEADEKTS